MLFLFQLLEFCLQFLHLYRFVMTLKSGRDSLVNPLIYVLKEFALELVVLYSEIYSLGEDSAAYVDTNEAWDDKLS